MDVAQQLRLALDAAALGTWRWDAATGEVSWDDQMREIAGVGPDWPGTYEGWARVLHPEDREAVLATLGEAIERGGRYELNHRVVRPDGSVRWIEGLGQVLRTPEGALRGTSGCARDITVRVAGARYTAQLQQVTSDLAGAMTVDELTLLVGRHLQGTVGATAGGVALLTPDRRSVRLRASFGYREDVVAKYTLLPLDAPTPLTHAVRTGTAVHLQREDLATAYPAIVEANRVAGSRSLVALPLFVAGAPIGGLVFGFREPQPLDEAQQVFFSALAGQVAQAVSRSVLVEQLRDVATELQAGLAPGDLPVVPGLELAAVYRPGGEAVEAIGGDWFDVVPLPGGQVAIVLGDVMGRGVRAATTMTRLRAGVRALVAVDPAPGVVAATLDRLVAREGLEEFVTVFYAVLDPATGVFEHVNAGHLPALVAQDGVARHLPTPQEPPVGLAARERTVGREVLEPGAVLMLYTDGLVERPDRHLDDGLGALARHAAAAAVSLPDLLARVTAAMRDELGPTGQTMEDDVTVLAVRRPARPKG